MIPALIQQGFANAPIQSERDQMIEKKLALLKEEEDILIGNLVDQNVSLKKRVDSLEGQNSADTLLDLEMIIEKLDTKLLISNSELNETETYNHILLMDIRDLYKRIDSKNEDIQILNTLIDNKG